MEFFDDILNYEPEEQEALIMDSKEYFERTKKLLQNIENAYSRSWKNRKLTEKEYPEESVCDKCTGCGLFKKDDGEEYECINDSEKGECFVRECDYEELGIELECEMDEVFTLLLTDKIKPEESFLNDIVLIASIDAKTKEGKFCQNIAKMSLKTNTNN